MDHVLVIDDEEVILKVLDKVLTHLGYKVKVAQDGEKGLELFMKDQDLDLVLTGICIPKMNGNDVAKYIRRSVRPETPVIAMTGSGEDAIHGGLFNFSLIKPFKLKSLIDGIKSLTQNH